MTLIMLNQNKTLKGHKLLLLFQQTPPKEQLDAIHSQFPHLKVVHFPVPFGVKELPDDFPVEELKDTTVILTGTLVPPKELVPNLQLVQIASAGANLVVDTPVFKDTDVSFCTANGVHGPQISEWVVATFLASQHELYKYRDQQKEGRWQRNQNLIDDAGILGYGAIGRQVARVATAMGMDVYAYTLHPRTTPESRHDDTYSPPGLGDPEGIYPSKWFSGGTKEEIHEFLGSGLDLLIVATPLTDKTHHLISKPEFEVLSAKKTFVSNIARGPIVNTDDLIEALDKDLIRGAALDVTDPEPLPDGHPLWSTKNLIITPHVSGMSSAYTQRVTEILRINLERLSEGKKFMNEVNRKNGY